MLQISIHPECSVQYRTNFFNFSIILHIHSVHEFADVRVYGGENAPNIFAVLYVSLMTKTLTICERLFKVFYLYICGFIV